MGKLVSVVVQAYNSDDTIVRTLESVKNQDYPDIELIVTDDKSKDNTIDIVNEWISQNKQFFKNVKLVTTQENTGIPGSNNRALKHVNGEYVEFLAADDLMSADAVSEYVKFCEENKNVIPVSRVKLFSDDDNCDFTSVENYCDKCYEFAKLSYKEQYKMLLIQNRVVAPAAAFYPTSVIRKLNGFDERFRWMEDYPINIKLMHERYRFGFIDKQLIHYRISGSSITGSNMSPLKKTEMEYFFKQKMWYMIQNGMAIEALKQSKSWFKVLFSR